ncbi:tripartite tricarboxylate transporter substrate binding protein [Cupriavidus necator]|uniref:Bug family tripartite tricarboxylate transporter substrate binding protein n=1 Tax=Cupriavidus necator TaxID=106590 RepID=UPI00339D3153
MRFEVLAIVERTSTWMMERAKPKRAPIVRRATALGGWLLLGGMITSVQPAWAAYPDQPVTIVVPYPPGGPADLMARPLSDGLQKALGAPVVLQYKPGAGGQIALRHIQRAKNDGYTLVLALAAYAIGPLVSRSAGYDPISDFQPVSLIAKQPLVLYVGATSRITSVSDLIVRAKSHPVTVASSGYGNTSHLAIELLSQSASIRVTHVPYHGGVQAVMAAISGDVDAVFAGADSLRHVKSGKLRALAIANDARLTIAPETPTFAEAGLQNMLVTGWYGVLAPKGTAKERIEKLDLAVKQVLSELSKSEVLSGYGFKVVHAGPSDFQAFIQQELARWSRLIADRNLVADEIEGGKAGVAGNVPR